MSNLTGSRSFRAALIALIVVCGRTTDATAQQQPDARTIVAESESIHTANGVEVREAVTIGGIKQWITVRGAAEKSASQ